MDIEYFDYNRRGESILSYRSRIIRHKIKLWRKAKLSDKPFFFLFCDRARFFGVMPKWLALELRKVIKFFWKDLFKRNFGYAMRGRGPRPRSICTNYDRDLPVRYAKKVRVYLTLK
jgi:hypothetical protein